MYFNRYYNSYRYRKYNGHTPSWYCTASESSSCSSYYSSIKNLRVSIYAASNLILDPDYPAMEPSPREYINHIFDRWFEVLLDITYRVCARKFSNLELCWCYSIPEYILHQRYKNEKYTPLFDDYIHYCNLFHFRSSVTATLIEYVGFSDDIAYSNQNCRQFPVLSDDSLPYNIRLDGCLS